MTALYDEIFNILSFSLIISLWRKIYKQLNHFIFVSVSCLSLATTPSLDSCKGFFSVLLCTMSIIFFLAWYRRDDQHSRNSSSLPIGNSANKRCISNSS